MEYKQNEVYDLRSALALLKEIPGQYEETDIPVDPSAEISGVYRYVGAGGTIQRPTKEGPALVYKKCKRAFGCQCCDRAFGKQKTCGLPTGMSAITIGIFIKG